MRLTKKLEKTDYHVLHIKQAWYGENNRDTQQDGKILCIQHKHTIKGCASDTEPAPRSQRECETVC